jgi:diadenosine tetraphosphate (Ap4A) HIT family hydrolase
MHSQCHQVTALVIPKRHVGSFFDVSDAERDALLGLLEVAKAAAGREFEPAGYNIGINDGSAAGQTVPHLHIHLIPRYDGDMPDPRGGVRWVIPSKAGLLDRPVRADRTLTTRAD